MKYDIKVKEVESVRIAYIPYNGKVQNMNKFFPQVFKAIQGRKTGSPFVNYLSFDVKTQVADMELCVPTEENPNSDHIKIKHLPASKVLSTIHKGSYETIMKGYAAIKQYSLEKSIELEPVFREVYIKGPGMIFKGNPRNYITEIQFVIKDSRP